MSIIEAYNKAWDEGDVGTLETIIHDDCVFNPHVGGMTCLLYTSDAADE